MNHTSTVSHTEPLSRVLGKVSLFMFSRLMINTARRFAYPFAPVLSRGLGVPLTAITSLIAVNQATGLFAIFLGPLADHIGYRVMILTGVGMLVGGMFASSLFPYYGMVLLALFLAGLGKSVFDPAAQAYISEKVPFERRGLAIGLLELSWSGSTLIGVPVLALLIDRFGWRAPFFALCGGGFVALTALSLFIPKDRKREHSHHSRQHFFKTLSQLIRKRHALCALGYALFASLANDNLFVVYGAWLEESFSLSILAIGVGTSVIGIAELTGEFLTATLADKLGLKRSIFFGLVLCILSYGLLPLTGRTLSFAMSGLFFVFLTFEFTTVGFISLCTELLPNARATMMAGFIAVSGIGRITGALFGGAAWIYGGIIAVSLISVAASVAALLCLLWGLRDWKQQ